MTPEQMMEHLEALQDAPVPEIASLSACFCGLLKGGDPHGYLRTIALAGMDVSRMEIKRLKAHIVLCGEVGP